MLTTANAAEGSALSLLRATNTDQRDESAAISKLVAAASASNNEQTKSSRTKFLDLTSSQKELLVSAIWIFDKAPSIVDVRSEIEDLLHFAAVGHTSELVSNLEGWWFNRVILALTGSGPQEVSLGTLEKKVFELSESYRLGSLPLDEHIDTLNVDDAAIDDQLTLTRQMNLVNASEQTIRASLRDYYRAYAQRSRWARESLFLDGEADRYDGSLIDAWTHEFASLCEDVDGADDETKCLKGREVLRWANRFNRPLRGRDEQWLSSGSYQMLADSLKVGWHPEYCKILKDDEGESE